KHYFNHSFSCLPLTAVPLFSDRWKGSGPRQRNLEVIVRGKLLMRMSRKGVISAIRHQSRYHGHKQGQGLWYCC
ncbi:hypothetical protein, partial [Oceanobacillus indicireducens]|uniref:hypothetical protein n=1 Tax=Oceanobacillus indicireducens TaxID=1004261 RepID=UPI001E3AEE82